MWPNFFTRVEAASALFAALFAATSSPSSAATSGSSQSVLLRGISGEETALCEKQVQSGKFSNYKQIASSLAPISQLKKGPFETGAEFERKKEGMITAALELAGVNASLPLLYASVPIYLSGIHSGKFLAKYDADSAIMNITIVDPTSSSYLTERFPASKRIDRAALGRLDTILLETRVDRERALELQNAFGMRRTTTDQSHLSYYWVYQVDAPPGSVPITIQFEMNPRDAERQLDDLRVIILGKLQTPYARALLIGG